MILVLDDEHKEDLKFVSSLSPETLGEFCKIALGFIQNGANRRVFTGAAKTLGVSVKVVADTVEGLAHLLSECARHKLSEIDFIDSLMLLNFGEELNKVLKEYYDAHVDEIRGILERLCAELPHYKELDWRLDVQVASRTMHNKVAPLYTLRLDTIENGEPKMQFLQADYANMSHLADQLENALKESSSHHCRRIMRNIK